MNDATEATDVWHWFDAIEDSGRDYERVRNFEQFETGDSLAITLTSEVGTGDGFLTVTVDTVRELGQELKVTDSDGRTMTVYADRAKPIVEYVDTSGDSRDYSTSRADTMYRVIDAEETDEDETESDGVDTGDGIETDGGTRDRDPSVLIEPNDPRRPSGLPDYIPEPKTGDLVRLPDDYGDWHLWKVSTTSRYKRDDYTNTYGLTAVKQERYSLNLSGEELARRMTNGDGEIHGKAAVYPAFPNLSERRTREERDAEATDSDGVDKGQGVETDGGTIAPSDVYDDRLQEPPHGQVERGDDDSLLQTAEEIADELAESHAPESVCAACTDETPLACTYARDVPKANKIQSLTDAVENRLTLWDPEASTHWVYSHLADCYITQFYKHLDDPQDCEICLYEDSCGHEREGEPCPVNEGDR